MPEDPRIVTGRDAAGADVFGFLIKRVYDVTPDGHCTPIQPSPPFLDTDVYHADPARSSPRYEAELAAFKPATDVVVIGCVHAPDAEPVIQLSAAIRVDGVRKKITVFGDRVATLRGRDRLPEFSEPQPFTAMPLVYERAYGGLDPADPMEFYYPRNPVGRGIVLDPAIIRAVRLPNIEDPDDLLTPERLILGEARSWNAQPLPQGLGWFGKTWYPRMSFVAAMPGWVDANTTMREESLGLVPAGQIALARQFRLPSFDARFCNGASLGLVLPYLRGDEAVELTNLSSRGLIRFRLPGDAPGIIADIGLGETTPNVRLYTVMIEPEQARLTLIWGATVRYPGAAWLPSMKRLSGRVLPGSAT